MYVAVRIPGELERGVFIALYWVWNVVTDCWSEEVAAAVACGWSRTPADRLAGQEMLMLMLNP